MRVLCFDTAVARSITMHDSAGFTLARIARTSETTVSWAHLEPQGVIGYHPTTVPQLLLVVEGTAQVRGMENEWQSLIVGQAAFWEAGEWHETRTETGLTAVIMESDHFSWLV